MDIRSSYDHNSVKFQNSLYDKYEKGAKRCVGRSIQSMPNDLRSVMKICLHFKPLTH